MCKSGVTTFSTGDAIDEISVTEVGDENVNFSGIIKRSTGVLNESSKLEKIAKELSIMEKVQGALTGVVNNHGGGLIMEDRVRAVEDKLQGAVAIAIGGRNQAKEGTVLGEHVFLGEKAEDGLRHAMKFEFHEVGKVSGGRGISGETAITTVMGAKGPQRVSIEAVVDTKRCKLRVPGANTSRRIIVTGEESLEKILVV